MAKEKIADRLLKLITKEPKWRVLHAVPTGERTRVAARAESGQTLSAMDLSLVLLSHRGFVHTRLFIFSLRRCPNPGSGSRTRAIRARLPQILHEGASREAIV